MHSLKRTSMYLRANPTFHLTHYPTTPLFVCFVSTSRLDGIGTPVLLGLRILFGIVAVSTTCESWIVVWSSTVVVSNTLHSEGWMRRKVKHTLELHQPTPPESSSWSQGSRKLWGDRTTWTKQRSAWCDSTMAKHRGPWHQAQHLWFAEVQIQLVR